MNLIVQVFLTNFTNKKKMQMTKRNPQLGLCLCFEGSIHDNVRAYKGKAYYLFIYF